MQTQGIPGSLDLPRCGSRNFISILAGVRGSVAEEPAFTLTDRMDLCRSQPRGSQALHNQSAINGVSGCGRILNVNCCKVLIKPIDLPDNCNR